MTGYRVTAVDARGRPLGATRHVRIDSTSATPPPSPAPVGDYPEDGTIGDVLAWVDEAPAVARTGRAKAAIVAEHGRTTPRKTLLAQLNERTGGRDALE